MTRNCIAWARRAFDLILFFRVCKPSERISNVLSGNFGNPALVTRFPYFRILLKWYFQRCRSGHSCCKWNLQQKHQQKHRRSKSLLFPVSTNHYVILDDNDDGRRVGGRLTTQRNPCDRLFIEFSLCCNQIVRQITETKLNTVEQLSFIHFSSAWS